MSVLHIFLLYFVFLKIHVICGQSPVGRHACGPPVFQALPSYQIIFNRCRVLEAIPSKLWELMDFEGYDDSKILSDGKENFESPIFRFPRAITIILFENEIFRDIFKDSGQHFNLQLLKLYILIKFDFFLKKHSKSHWIFLEYWATKKSPAAQI